MYWYALKCWLFGQGLTRIIQSLYYAPAGRYVYINAWMHSLKKSVKPEIVNRYVLSNFEIKNHYVLIFKNSNYSFKFYFMFGCIYPDMCIAYNITSSDRSIGHYLQNL
jgi:hypothetical protein